MLYGSTVNIQRLKEEYEARQRLIVAVPVSRPNRIVKPRKARAKRNPKPKGLSPKAWYRAYLRKGHWKSFRLTILAKRGPHCEMCLARNIKAELHHVSYERVGRELESDVIVVCGDCHRQSHGHPTAEQLKERFAIDEGITRCHTPKWMSHA